MIKAKHTTLNLQFKFPAGTSRGVLLHKPSSFLLLEKDGFRGIGECSTIPNLSIDPVETYSEKLEEVCRLLNEGVDPDSIDLSLFPSIAFGLETALLDLKAKGSKCLLLGIPPSISNLNSLPELPGAFCCINRLHFCCWRKMALGV